jgi:hypothetical protein
MGAKDGRLISPKVLVCKPSRQGTSIQMEGRHSAPNSNATDRVHESKHIEKPNDHRDHNYYI